MLTHLEKNQYFSLPFESTDCSNALNVYLGVIKGEPEDVIIYPLIVMSGVNKQATHFEQTVSVCVGGQ
jgi:hypothetical protein